MRNSKLAVIALAACLFADGKAMAQYGGSGQAKFSHEQEAMIAHYKNVRQEMQRDIDALKHAMGEIGEVGAGKQPGAARIEELSKRISEKKAELDESKRLISRGRSKQAVIRTKIVRIEKDLSRVLNQMPNDPVAQALSKLVEIDDAAVQRMRKKFESGQISSDELANAERKLAESRLELAKHQWEESAEARKALATASSALEDAVFDTEMMTTEGADLEKEIDTMSAERGRIVAMVRELDELTRRAEVIEQLLSVSRSGNSSFQDRLVEKLRGMGVKAYEPDKRTEKPAEPARDPGK